jgi:hypothetical protein
VPATRGGFKTQSAYSPHQNEGHVLRDLVNFICVIRFSEKFLNQGFGHGPLSTFGGGVEFRGH